ncbi:hypothetical protein ACQ4M3_06335 [Leptolyngbya sp. AN03gr2]|uniref:hypothetical protein n=1 Tax=unclassified Leptolyngbya TaxID=2650499 RepID=UPI003D30EFA4
MGDQLQDGVSVALQLRFALNALAQGFSTGGTEGVGGEGGQNGLRGAVAVACAVAVCF